MKALGLVFGILGATCIAAGKIPSWVAIPTAVCFIGAISPQDKELVDTDEVTR